MFTLSLQKNLRVFTLAIVISFVTASLIVLTVPTASYHFAAHAQESCTDSDAGLNYYVKGGASRGNTPPYTDSCYCPIGDDRSNLGACTEGAFVGEWICNASGYTEMKTYECPNGCRDGACIQKANTWKCTDSDGGENLDTKGKVEAGPYGAGDLCESDYVVEWTCNPDPQERKHHSAGWLFVGRGGAMGEIIEQGFGHALSLLQTTSTSAVFEWLGTEYTLSIGIEQELGDSGLIVKLEEIRDESAHIRTQQRYYAATSYPCPHGCENGACKKDSGNFCTDSDGKDIFTRGTLRTNAPSWDPVTTITDQCMIEQEQSDGVFVDVTSCSGSNCYINEYICSGSEPDFLMTRSGKTPCPNGCSNGACLKVASSSCSDSDDGLTPDVRGTTSGVLQGSGAQGSWKDECGFDGDPQTLKEFICTSDGTVRGTSYICELGCSEGACKRNVHTPQKPAVTAPNNSDIAVPSAGYEDEVRVLDRAPSSKNWFRDLNSETHEAKAANFLAENNIIGGFPDGTFREDKLVNRAEAAKFLMLAQYRNVDGRMNSGRFWDILEGEWYVPFVMKAAELGVINGHPDGSFKPQDPVKVGEFLKMLALTFNLPINLSYQDDPDGFVDVHPDDWFAPYADIAMVYDLPFVTHAGPEDSGWMLRPERELTRGEVAIAIYTILGLSGE